MVKCFISNTFILQEKGGSEHFTKNVFWKQKPVGCIQRILEHMCEMINAKKC